MPSRGLVRDAAELAPEEIRGEDYSFTFYLRAKSGDGVHIVGQAQPAAELRAFLEDVALSEVEVLEPRAIDLADAAPLLERPRDAMQWLEAHGGNGPVARHALRIFETVGAIDLTVDTLACALLHGNVDGLGQPGYDAVVGGAASHWDEESGELVVRAVVGWGGKGVSGETERIAQKLLGVLHGRIVARALQAAPLPDRGRGAAPAPEGQVCAHCGFVLSGPRATFCPECGMRLPQG